MFNLNKLSKFNFSYLFFGFLLFIFAPIEIYLTSITELWFSIKEFIIYLLILFFFYFAFWFLYQIVLAKHFPRVEAIISETVFMVSLAFYIQGNFFKVRYGEMNGKAIDWSSFKTEGVISASIFIVCFLIAAFIAFYIVKHKKYTKINRFFNICSACAILLMIYTLAVLFISQYRYLDKDKYVPISDGRWNYSEADNFIILLLDNFDSRSMDELLSTEDKEEVEETLTDFTYYEDAKGLYEYTILAVPQILTGEQYLNQKNYDDYQEEAYNQSPFLNELINKGYKLQIHTSVDIPQGDFVNFVDNWKYMKIGVSSRKKLLIYLYKLCGIRYLPQEFKKYCWFYTDDMDDLKEVEYVNSGDSITAEDAYYEWHNKYFVDNLDKLNANEDEPVFHFTHLKGCHDRRDMDSDYSVLEDGEVSRYDSSLMNVRIIRDYLNVLKENNIYDNSVIIIMADHGEIKYYESGEKPYLQSPLLLVKGKNENHDFAVSSEPVSYSYLQNDFINLLNGETSKDAMKVTDYSAKRYTYLTDFSTEAKKGRQKKMNEYAVNGGAKDENSIELTGNSFW